MLGESAASASLNTLSVPLTGLAIGFNAFASAAAVSQEDSIHLANYFYSYEQELSKYKVTAASNESDFHKDIFAMPVVPLAYKNWIYNNNKFQSANYTNAMIKEVDLSKRDQIKLQFGDHYVYQTSRYEDLDGLSHTYISSFGPNPRAILDNHHLIPIKNLLHFTLGDEDFVILDKISTSKPIILPIVPTTDISYNFGYTPGILSRHDAELSSVLKMQKYGNFLFEYMTGIFTEFSIRELFFDYKSTEITIKLGENNRFLFTPVVPDNWKNLITYNIYGNKGHYFLKTAEAVNYKIHTNSANEKWIIDMGSIKSNIKIENNSIKFGNNCIQFPSEIKAKEILLLHANGAISSVQLDTEKQNYISYDFSKLNLSKNDFIIMLQSQSVANNQAHGYIEVEKYPVDSTYSSKSWYDIEHNTIISPLLLSKKSTQIDLFLVGRVGDYIYYYDQKNSDIYFQEKNKRETYLLESNVKNIQLFPDHIIVEKLDKYIISFFDPRKKTLLEVISNKISKNEIHKIAKENGYNIGNEVLLFNHTKKFIGWYLSNIDIMVDVDKINNHIKG
ncbi:TcdA/TcdB pore-forming domain-containing protein [Fluviispira sanaruensis]|uniref:TcdA/TcdB toxin pore forming domain-containing protein n=1 Tax=Fluviispira sanaruensis TaxID=2493639 RepID=A0A4V0P2N1_FLUSA|nr:TcdA/TcdB pore-forming domain-containing protein [Fluviispira sanaruensis]BBH53807.1 hypothetical protein JCM31447_22570 [Fluviispira sanaruensis]